MNKERFAEILKEYDYTDNQIDILWKTKPPGALEEDALRKVAVKMKDTKDDHIQA